MHSMRAEECIAWVAIFAHLLSVCHLVRSTNLPPPPAPPKRVEMHTKID